MRKKLLKIPLLTALAAAVLCAGAMAAEIEINMGYTGPLDTFTGAPAVSSGADAGAEAVRISDRVRYSGSDRMFVYPVGASLHKVVRASVMDGMITNRPVSISPDEGVPVSLFRNGEYQTDPVWTEISTPGEYVVTEGTGSQAGDRLFSFTVVGAYSNTVKAYRMPESFQIMEATLNGEDIYFERNFVDLSEEGEYSVRYRCIRTDEIYELEYKADFTAPVLALAAVEDGVADGPVDLSDLEPGASVGVWLNGDPIGYDEELTRSGSYVVKVADEAGNLNTYRFTIRIYFDSNSLIFFAIIVAVLAGTVAYVVISRKRLRVR